ncbi:10903_t:CDS:2 [Paraglomus brasilianum]|uniref:10903_t:CDS:1 n=1 Tax=Paraglomus brasilianum TaxID=144538 RepID=A0A9N9AW16_9GLOM|nr:10903_t:CDS:2 [Paraglomus brasilianum]
MSEQSDYKNFTNGQPMFNPDSDYVNSRPLEMTSPDSNNIFSYPHSQQTFRFPSEMSSLNSNTFSYPPSQQAFGYQCQDYYCPSAAGFFDNGNTCMGGENGPLDTANNGNAENNVYLVNDYAVNYTSPERPVQTPFLFTFSNNAGTVPNTGYVVLVVQVDMDKIVSILQ